MLKLLPGGLAFYRRHLVVKFGKYISYLLQDISSVPYIEWISSRTEEKSWHTYIYRLYATSIVDKIKLKLKQHKVKDLVLGLSLGLGISQSKLSNLARVDLLWEGKFMATGHRASPFRAIP